MNRRVSGNPTNPFQRNKDEARPMKERRPGVNGNLAKKSTSSSSPVMTLEVVDSDESEDDDDKEEASKSRRRKRADDDSDEDPHFRSKVKKSELKAGGESRSLRSKGSPPPQTPLIPRVSEGKVMSRKRHKSSASKAKASTSSALPMSKGSSKISSTSFKASSSPASDSPDLVCLDSDDEDFTPSKKTTTTTMKESNVKTFNSKQVKTSFVSNSASKPSEICIDDDDDEPRSVKKGTGIKKKRKFRVKDRTLVMPIHKYYYGWAEGEKTTNFQQMFRFRCSRDSCQHTTYDNISAMRHAIVHAKEGDNGLDADIFSELIRCPTCFLPFKSRYKMQSHFEKQHPVLATKSKGPHRCKICEREMNGQEKFVQHMRLYHIQCDMPYVCPICFFRSSIYNMVVDHFLASHANGQDALCPHCLKSFSIKPSAEEDKFGDLTGYMSHLAEHAITKRHKCQQCRLIFTKGNHLSSHVQCDHKTAKGEIKEIAASLIADFVPVTVSEATSRREDLDDAVDSGNASSSSSDQSNHRSQAILSSFVMTLGQRAGPQSLTAEGLKAWNLQCKECHRPFDFAGHFRTATAKKFVQCNKCNFITTCSFAYAKHMIFFHGTAVDRGKIVPKERKVKEVVALQCRLCDFKTEYGNKMAAHMMKAEHKDGRCVVEVEVVEKKEEEGVKDERYEKIESIGDEGNVRKIESSHTIELSEDGSGGEEEEKEEDGSKTHDITFEVIDSDSDESDFGTDANVNTISNDNNDDDESMLFPSKARVVESDSKVAYIVTEVLEEILSVIDPQESSSVPWIKSFSQDVDQEDRVIGNEPEETKECLGEEEQQRQDEIKRVGERTNDSMKEGRNYNKEKEGGEEEKEGNETESEEEKDGIEEGIGNVAGSDVDKSVYSPEIIALSDSDDD